MKKLISFLTAVSLTASLPIFSVYAEGNTDLESLAVSLGADKDYLAVPNMYYPAELYQANLYDYFIPVSTSEQMTSLASGVAKYSDTSFGSSVLSVLVHNGVISAGNVKENAESLSKINNILLAKDSIYKYQNILDNDDFKLYTEYLFKSQNFAQKADSLISTAEKCMNEGRYFLIMYSAFRTNPSTGHAMRGQQAHSAVGIGVTDGSWTFNDKTYDKCILTLDSLSVDSKNDAFSEDTCIYINSETKDYYMPKISASAESDIHIIAVDNDQLLNFADTDVTDEIVSLNIATDSISEVTYTDLNGNEVILNDDNNFLDNYHIYSNVSFLVKGNNFKISTASENEDDYISITDKEHTLDFDMEKADSEIFCNDNTLKFTRKDSWGITYRKPEDPLKFSLYIHTKNSDIEHYIKGETMGESEFTKVDGGIIFSGGKAILNTYQHNEAYEENPKEEEYNKTLSRMALNSDGKVFIQIGDDYSVKLFSDLDSDGTFEHEVQKGDLNCDGVINSVDVSMLLEAYADMASSAMDFPDVYTSTQYADINGDGVIDSVDASEILEIYAQNSTK